MIDPEDVLTEEESTAIIRAGMVLEAGFGPSGMWLKPDSDHYQENRAFVDAFRTQRTGPAPVNKGERTTLDNNS